MIERADGRRVGLLCTSQPRCEFPLMLRCISDFRDQLGYGLGIGSTCSIVTKHSGALCIFVSNRRSHQVTESDSTSIRRFRGGRDLGTARSFCVIDYGARFSLMLSIRSGAPVEGEKR